MAGRFDPSAAFPLSPKEQRDARRRERERARSQANQRPGVRTRRDDYLVVASNGGADRPPTWLYNLQAKPDVEIQIGREHRKGTARVVGPSDDGYERLWKAVDAERPRPQQRLPEETMNPYPSVAITPA